MANNCLNQTNLFGLLNKIWNLLIPKACPLNFSTVHYVPVFKNIIADKGSILNNSFSLPKTQINFWFMSKKKFFGATVLWI